jgi:hypothetical protein
MRSLCFTCKQASLSRFGHATYKYIFPRYKWKTSVHSQILNQAFSYNRAEALLVDCTLCVAFVVADGND